MMFGNSDMTPAEITMMVNCGAGLLIVGIIFYVMTAHVAGVKDHLKSLAFILVLGCLLYVIALGNQ